MFLESSAFQPCLSVLSPKDKLQIFKSALQLMSRIGMFLFHEEALILLAEAGCGIDENHRVTVPRHLVEKALASAPADIPVYDRDGRPAMNVGGRRTYFGTGSDLMFSLDAKSMQRRPAALKDVARAATVCDALKNIDFIMSFAHDRELNPHHAYLESFWTMVQHSTKPIVNTAECRRDLSAMWGICQVLRNSEAAAREKSYTIHYAEPISPLKHPFDSIDKLMFCAQTGMPVIYSPAPIAGSTAPMTVAGHVVQGLAESLFGLVVHQLVSPGAPFLMGMGAAVLDMRTSQCSYNAPEYLMAYLAMVEMSHYCNLPNWGYAGTTDSQIPDGQATFEAGLLTYMSSVSGSNLNHDVGYLDFGLTGSLDMVVIMDEAIDMIRRLQQGIVVDDEHVALDVIAEAALSGEFLSHAHTLKHVKTTQWLPSLISRDGHEKWSQTGEKTLLDRAADRLADILATHHPNGLNDRLKAVIQQQVEGFQGRAILNDEC